MTATISAPAAANGRSQSCRRLPACLRGRRREDQVRRSFTSFTQAADENGVSHIYNGFHFRDAVNNGIKHGRKIADRAVRHFLRPVH